MIVQKYPHLMAPFSVKGVHFKNHIFLAPCALSHVTYGAPNDLGIEYIEEKARGGFQGKVMFWSARRFRLYLF